METILSYILFLTSVAVILVTFFFMKNRGLPKGPWTLPFIGDTAFSDNKKFIIFLRNLESKYGHIFRFRQGCRHVTVVGGLENIKQVLEQKSVQPYCHWSNYITKVQAIQGTTLLFFILYNFLINVIELHEEQ